MCIYVFGNGRPYLSLNIYVQSNLPTNFKLLLLHFKDTQFESILESCREIVVEALVLLKFHAGRLIPTNPG